MNSELLSTRATTSTTPAPRPTTKPRKRRKVDHLYWAKDANAAAQMGVFEVPSVCRRAWVKMEGDPLSCPPDSGGRAKNTRPDQCRECVRIAEAKYWRMRDEGQQQ